MTLQHTTISLMLTIDESIWRISIKYALHQHSSATFLSVQMKIQAQRRHDKVFIHIYFPDLTSPSFSKPYQTKRYCRPIQFIYLHIFSFPCTPARIQLIIKDTLQLYNIY